MKKWLVILFIGSLITACNSNKKTENRTPVVHTSNGDYNSYGSLITPDSTIDATTLLLEMGNAPTYETKVKGKIVDVCQKKGCWMNIDIGNGEYMRVIFRDYAFFVPKDIIGKEAIIQGVAKFESVSVEDQKHLLEDAGESKEKIDAIVEPQNELEFEAVGVLISKSPTEQPVAAAN